MSFFIKSSPDIDGAANQRESCAHRLSAVLHVYHLGHSRPNHIASSGHVFVGINLYTDRARNQGVPAATKTSVGLPVPLPDNLIQCMMVRWPTGKPLT